MKYGWEFSNGLLVPIITDNLLTPLGLVEISSWVVRRNVLAVDVSISKTILSARTL